MVLFISTKASLFFSIFNIRKDFKSKQDTVGCVVTSKYHAEYF